MNVARLRVARPFETVEAINDSAQQTPISSLNLRSVRAAERRVIWSGNKCLLPSLLSVAGAAIRPGFPISRSTQGRIPPVEWVEKPLVQLRSRGLVGGTQWVKRPRTRCSFTSTGG